MDQETKQAIGEVIEKTVEAAEEVVQRPGIKTLARLGFYTKGFLFIVIGTLAILMVVGLRGGRIADTRGALTAVAEEPYGKVFLLIFFVGAIGHGIWNMLRGAADIDDLGRKWQAIVRRCISIGIGLFYLGLAISALELVLAANVTEGNSQAEETFIALLLGFPLLGAGIVGIVGLGFVGAGVSEWYSGLSGKFRETYRVWEISGFHLTFIKVLGITSFTARALLLAVMGYFFIVAAFDNRASGAIGLDAALLALLQTTYGRLVVLLTAIGLVGHGILAFYEARYRRIA